MPRYYILTPDAKFERLDFPGELKGTPVDVTLPMTETLSKKIPVSVRNVSLFDSHPVNLTVVNNTVFVSTRLLKLRIKANFQTQKDDLLLPAWGNTGHKELSLDWKVPDTMHLRFGIEWSTNTAKIQNVYLFIFDDEDRSKTYKVPLPNIYTNGKICLPREFQPYHGTVLDALEYAHRAVAESGWNDHLIRENREVDKSIQLFQFRAVKEGFETVDVGTKWRTICNTLGNAAVAHMMP